MHGPAERVKGSDKAKGTEVTDPVDEIPALGPLASISLDDELRSAHAKIGKHTDASAYYRELAAILGKRINASVSEERAQRWAEKNGLTYRS